MRKSIKPLVAFMILYLFYGMFLNQYDITIIPDTLEQSHPEGFYDYAGALNVHTHKSSGSGKFEEVVQAAQNSGLDFIYITDLNNFSPEKHLEKYYGRVLVFVDAEYSFLDNRFLVLNQKNYSNFTDFGQTQVELNDRINRGEPNPEEGQLVIAHPLKRGFKWQGRIPNGVDGLEVINLKAIWQQVWFNQTFSFFWSALIYPFNPELALLRMFPFPTKEMELWDENSKKRKLLGFAGTDAEARLKIPRDSGLRIPNYETVFNIVRTHVLLKSELTGIAERDLQKVSEAIQSGSFYFSIDKVGSPKGFLAIVENTEGNVYSMGEEIPMETPLKLKVELPQKPLYPFDTIIYRNGEKVISSNSKVTEYFIQEAGTYRVVVRVIPTFPLPDGKRWVPWIFSNPFFVKNSKGSQ